MRGLKNLSLLLAILFLHVICPVQESCRVQGLAGTQPEYLCIVQEFLKAWNNIDGKKTIKKFGLLVYGVHGIGKTLFAKALSKNSGVIVKYYSYRDILFQEGPWIVPKIKEIFEEAEKEGKKKGKPVVVVFDNVDGSFLDDGSHLSRDHQNGLIEVAFQINKPIILDQMFAVIIANNPNSVPSKLVNVCSAVEMKAPDYQNRKEIIQYYATRYGILLSQELINKLAENEFSGRSIERSFLMGKSIARARDNAKLNEGFLCQGFEWERHDMAKENNH